MTMPEASIGEAVVVGAVVGLLVALIGNFIRSLLE